jgi:hypothetical protein
MNSHCLQEIAKFDNDDPAVVYSATNTFIITHQDDQEKHLVQLTLLL